MVVKTKVTLSSVSRSVNRSPMLDSGIAEGKDVMQIIHASTKTME